MEAADIGILRQGEADPTPEKEDEFDKNKIQIIYLNWFWKDWSIVNNAVYSGVEGLRIREDSFKNRL